MLVEPAEVFSSRREIFRPPANIALSAWADENFYLSPESAAEPGRWTTLPYQRGIMDAISDPEIERVSFMKSSRVGATKMMNATIAFYMAQDPCPIMVVQPTQEDAEGYSKEEITPMLRDCPSLRALVGDPTVKATGQTIKHKTFPGGLLHLVGSNSPRNFRRVSRRVVIFDEVDAYPASSGTEGDPISLGIKRTQYYHNRKIVAASTPGLAGASRIEQLFEAGDQRRYHVPCPHCGHRDYLTFGEKPDRGHWLTWDDDDPSTAHVVCRGGGCVIEHHHKRQMLEEGEWVADGEPSSHASFHIWAGYSLAPNDTWPQLAAEFIEAGDDEEKLKAHANTVKGETWANRGEAPAWELLFLRRESYRIGTVPAGVAVVTCAVDVQKDRLVFETVGWGLNKESWLIDAGLLYGDTSDAATWRQLDELLAKEMPASDGSRTWSIAKLAIDSGYNTQQVYAWARKYRAGWRVIACKGMSTARSMLGTPSPVELNLNGRKIARGYKVWPVAPHIAKAELYGWLRLGIPVGEAPPPGYCHFPEVGEEYFKQLTGEHVVPITKRSGFVVHEWHLIAGRENHWLDTRVLNRVAALALGLDRAKPPDPPSEAAASPTPAPRPKPKAPRKDAWIKPRPNWMKRRR